MIEVYEETEAEQEWSRRKDVTGHEKDFSLLAKFVLERISFAACGRREVVCVRRCSGFWFVFNGKVYDRLDAERMGVLARRCLNRCYYRKRTKTGEEYEERLDPTTHTVQETLNAMVELRGVVSELEPDQDQDELVCESGRVDLHTGALRPHDATVFSTRMARVELPREAGPELAAARERWLAYLAALELGDATLGYIRRAFGYSVTGRGCEKAFFFLHGEKNTSKTTVLRLVQDVLGKTRSGGYSADTDCTDWLDNGPKNQGHTDSLMVVEGARLVFGDETGENARFHEARIKRAVGGSGSELPMSRKGEQGRSVPIRFGLWFSSNHLPYTQDNATQERLKLITHTKVVENPDPNFQARFLTPHMRQAILLWLVEAAGEYLKSGLGTEPPSVILAREEYALENDWFGTFLRERLGRKTNMWADATPLKATAINAECARWAKEMGIRTPVSPTKLPKMVERRTGVKGRMLHGCKVFDGLALRYDSEGFPREGVVDLELVQP